MTRRATQDAEPLLIDRAAAAEMPSPGALREWAGDKRVFISSVMAELAAERRAAAEAVRAVGARPILFEEFGGRDADPEDAYLGEVETSHIYLGILGARYGTLLATRFSATHTEYLHAEMHGLRIAPWVLRTDAREGHQQAFVTEVRKFHVAPDFTTPPDLQRQIGERLRAIAAEDLAPWCKLGHIVFRAGEITHRRDEILVAARVHSPDVAHALEGFRPDAWGRPDATRFTWAGHSRYLSVKEVESTVTASRSRTMRLRLEVVEGPRDHDLEMTVSGYTPDDLTEIALRSALFNEPSPLARDHFGFYAEMRDPLRGLRQARAPEEIIRPLAELLVVDELVGSTRAARVTEFRLGVPIRGVRPLKLSWLPPRRYSGERARTRTVEGVVGL